jgi:hypothetical protein
MDMPVHGQCTKGIMVGIQTSFLRSIHKKDHTKERHQKLGNQALPDTEGKEQSGMQNLAEREIS